MKRPGDREGVVSRQYLNDIAKELFRKSIHMCSAFIPLFMGIAKVPVLVLLALALGFYVICESLRLKGINVPLVSEVTAAAARKRDENRFVLGPVTLCLGIILCSIIWKQKPASIGIYALAFGDGLASLTGKLFGRVRIPLTQGKTAAGSLACFTAIFISSFLAGGSASVSLILAGVGMFIELMPLKDLDNAIIPVLIGGLAQYLLA